MKTERNQVQNKNSHSILQHPGIVRFFLLLFLISTLSLFSQASRLELIKVSKKNDSILNLPYPLQAKIVQELKTCLIARTSPELTSNLFQNGFEVEILDSKADDKKYYLVRLQSPSQLSILKYYGKAQIVENNVALFWTDGIPARKVLPAQFQIVSLPDKPVFSLNQEPQILNSASLPITKFPQELYLHPTISSIVDQVSKENLKSYIKDLQDFQTRYSSTPNCEEAGDFIYNFFVQNRIKAEYDNFSFEKEYSSRNIIGTLKGKVDPSQVVILCAHYDSTSDNPSVLAPGADDDASGTSAIMEALRVLSKFSFDFSIKFVCFSAEEWGLYGSQHFAQTARQKGEDIIAVINLDMIGYTDFLPEDLDIVSNNSSEWLADKYFFTTKRYVSLSVSKTVDSSFIWSDHSSFWNNGFSAIAGIEDTRISNPYYHTAGDTVETLNLDFMTKVVKASLAVAAVLAQPVSTPMPPTGLTSHSQIVSSLFSSIKTAYLNWNIQNQANGYNVYRTTISRTNYQKLNQSLLTQNYYVDRYLEPDVLYYYVVTTVDNQGRESNFSRQVRDNEGN